MRTEILTNPVQVIQAELVDHLPPEILLVLATDPSLDLRPRLHIHDRRLNPHAYVVRYRCRLGDVVSWRTVYLGALSPEEVVTLQVSFGQIRAEAARHAHNRPLAYYEAAIICALDVMQRKLRNMRMMAELCGYRIHGARLRRSGARGVRIENQALPKSTPHGQPLAALEEFEKSTQEMYRASSRLAIATQKMLYALAVHSTRRAPDAPPRSRVIRYEGTLGKVLRYRDMAQDVVNRIAQDMQTIVSLEAL